MPDHDISRPMDDELGCLKAAYGNCLNDLARTKAHLKHAEDTLRRLANLLHGKADDLHAGRLDDPGSGGSGGA
jgi:hypothetical protein